MRLTYFLLILVVISIANISRAENHSPSPNSVEEFEIAVKHVEKKNFLDAVKIFNELSQAGLPEAQFNLSLLHSNGLGTPKNYKTAL